MPVRQDGLVVVVSTDCGATADEIIYNRYGSALATSASQPAPFVPTTDDEWRSEVLSLDRYAGYPQVQLVWTAVNGNNLCADDVELFITDYDGVRPAESTFHIEPNPVISSQLTVEVNLPEIENINFSIYSLQGKLLLQHPFDHALNQTYTLSTAHLSRGMYVLRMVGERGTVSTQRFIVR